MARNKFSFKFMGLDKLIKDLETLPNNVIQELDIELAQSAEKVVVDAKSAVPRNTGAGANSISYHREKILDYKVGASAHYMPYVEFGTGTFVNVPAGLEDYAMQFKGRGIRQVNLPARPFLFPAYEAERIRLIERLKKTLLKNSMDGITVIQPGGMGHITGVTTI